MKLPSRKQYSNDVDSITNRIYSNYNPISLEDLTENIFQKEFPHIYEMMHFKAKFWKHSERHEFLGIQNVYTPFEKIFTKDTFDLIKFLSEHQYFESYLFMYNWEIFIYLFKNGLLNYFKNKRLFYAVDSKEDEVICKLISRICKIDIKIIKIYDFKDKKKSYEDNIKEAIKKCMEECGVKHFDLVLSNPPYASSANVGLDVKILFLTLKNFSSSTIFIQPSAWALRTVYKMKIQKDFVNEFGKYIKNIIFIDPKLFGDGCKKFEPLVISYIDKRNINKKINVKDTINNIEYNADSIFDVNIFANVGKWEITKSIIKKINDYIKINGSCGSHIIPHSEINDFSVWISLIRGNASNRLNKNGTYNKSYCSLINQDESNKITSKTVLKDRDLWVWKFNSIQEQKNFIEFCKLKIVKFSQAIYKFDGNVNMNDVPWFDFTIKWTDEKLCKELKFSNEEWEWIDKFIEY